ncbi:hypothetical protein FACUT_13536 [Fusarium acutatum]|uniref:Uncharacterized protein n=1 Tax=Fusarium acutatum TaxID=78861 RepID=A0A8H4NAP8_9HYPO|nr:hypothetical protein FACUT_13536 [Fusarium acutatum]
MLTLASLPLHEVKAALPGRATRMNQWTFFNKKIETFKAQPNDGSAPSTPVKKATSGKPILPLWSQAGPKAQDSVDHPTNVEPVAQVVTNQTYQAQQVLTGNFIPMNEGYYIGLGDGEKRPLPGRAPNPQAQAHICIGGDYAPQISNSGKRRAS